MPYNRYVSEEYGTFPLPAVRMGKTGEPQLEVAGGVKATGSIVFADNPTVADTITINGVVFTFVASGATGNQINISGVDLPGTLTNMVSVLQGSAEANVALATYTDDATNTLIITYDTYEAAGNLFTLAASADTPSGATLTGGQDMGIISILTEPTKIAITQSVDQYFTMADGDETQRKLLYAPTKGTGNAIVTPANLTGGTTITFGTAAMYAVLRFMNGSWVVTAGTATVA